MARPKKNTETTETKRLSDDFSTLPLEEKVAELVRMEAATIAETLTFVLNSPFEVFGKVLDVVAQFGIKLDNADYEKQKAEKNATEPKPKRARKAKTEVEEAAEPTSKRRGRPRKTKPQSEPQSEN